VLEWIDEWGDRLLKASLFYTIIAMIVEFTAISSGYTPPALVPRSVFQVYNSTYNQWLQISGKVVTVNGTGSSSILSIIINSFNLFFLGIISFLFTVTFSFVWLGVTASQLLPPLLDVLRIPIWVMAVFANIVLLLYLIKLVYNTFRSIAGSVFGVAIATGT